MLRGFQTKLDQEVQAAWDAGHQNVIMQSATGSGKTVVMGHIARKHMTQPWDARRPYGYAIAHRNELVAQMSTQFAREGVPHDIIAPRKIIRQIVDSHMEDFGRTFYNPRSVWRVAGVDTLVRKEIADADKVGMCMIDEAHHVQRENKWGRALAPFGYARGLLPTATPIRADKRGLSRASHGVADALVIGPPQRQLINEGYLTDYRIYNVPPSDLDLDGVHISASGDFNPKELAEATHKSKKIVGDAVATYCKYARGKLGVTFAVDIAHAREIAEAFNNAGVPALVVTGEDDPTTRRRALKAFARREVWQLVNVDLFGEGFDLPAIECVSFARATASFSLYCQQWGRALRLMIDKALSDVWDTFSVAERLAHIAASGKPFAYIFDHANNFYRHEGPPDKPRIWSMEPWGGASNGGGSGVPMRVCLNPACAKPYERFFVICPYCDEPAPPPVERSTVEAVDGDITLMSPEVLAKYMREVARIDDVPYVPAGVPRMPVVMTHQERQRAQFHLRQTVALWAGSYNEHPDRVNYKRFYFVFGIDVLSAKALNTKDATELQARINADLIDRGFLPYVYQT